MDGARREKIEDIPVKHKSIHEGYEYYKREFLPKGAAEQCAVAVYEIPPGRSAYPYHSHTRNEEVFYIISGQGILRTPEGETAVSAGELLFFPANADGAHKLTNPSDSEPLVYIDFDTVNPVDTTFYPDSGKIGVWGGGINRLYRIDDDVDYYCGE